MQCYGIKLASDDRIRYVGLTTKSLEERFAQHIYAARVGTASALYRWMRKHAEDKIEIVNLLHACSHAEMNQQEVFLIEAYRSIGQADLNLTDGGTGGVTPLIIEKIKRTFATPEHKMMRSRITTEVWTRPEVKEMARRSRELSDAKPETKKNRSEAASLWQADPLIRLKQSEKAKAAIARADVAARRSAAMLEVQKRPDVAKKKSEKMKAFWVAKRAVLKS